MSRATPKTMSKMEVQDSTGRKWPSHAAMVDYYLAEGFTVSGIRCAKCKHSCVGIYDPDNRPKSFACPKCHKMTGMEIA